MSARTADDTSSIGTHSSSELETDRMEETVKVKRVLFNPVDKGWSWVILLSAFVIQVNCIGFLRSFGVLFVPIQTTFGVPASSVSLVFGLQAAIFSVSALFTMTVLIERMSVRNVARLGSVLCAAGISLCYLADSLLFYTLAQSLLCGVGLSMCFGPGFVLVSTYFDKRRALAVAVANTGGSIGTLFLPLITRFLLEEYALAGTYLLLGAIFAQNLVFAGFYTPPEDYKGREEEDDDEEKVKLALSVDEKVKLALNVVRNLQKNGLEEEDKESFAPTVRYVYKKQNHRLQEKDEEENFAETVVHSGLEEEEQEEDNFASTVVYNKQNELGKEKEEEEEQEEEQEQERDFAPTEVFHKHNGLRTEKEIDDKKVTSTSCELTVDQAIAMALSESTSLLDTEGEVDLDCVADEATSLLQEDTVNTQKESLLQEDEINTNKNHCTKASSILQNPTIDNTTSKESLDKAVLTTEPAESNKTDSPMLIGNPSKDNITSKESLDKVVLKTEQTESDLNGTPMLIGNNSKTHNQPNEPYEPSENTNTNQTAFLPVTKETLQSEPSENTKTNQTALSNTSDSARRGSSSKIHGGSVESANRIRGDSAGLEQFRHRAFSEGYRGRGNNSGSVQTPPKRPTYLRTISEIPRSGKQRRTRFNTMNDLPVPSTSVTSLSSAAKRRSRNSSLNLSRMSLMFLSYETVYLPPLETMQVVKVEEITEPQREETCGEKVRSILSMCFDPVLFKSPLFWLLIGFQFFGILGMNMPGSFLPPLALEKGLTMSEAALMLTVLGAVDILGRLLPGFVAQLGWLRPQTMVIISYLLMGTVFQLTGFFNSLPTMLCLAVVNGFCAGCYVSMMQLITIDFVGLDKFPKAFGLVQMSIGVATSVFMPFLGFLRDLTGSYVISFHVIGACAYLSSVLLLLEPLVRRLERVDRTST